MTGQRFDARLLGPPQADVQGTRTTSDHPFGATTLLVEMAGDFVDHDPETELLEVVRGYLLITPALQSDADPVAPFVLPYFSWDGEEDEQEFILLAQGLPAAVPTDSRVDVWSPNLDFPLDVTLGEVAKVYEAPVMPDDEDVNGEAKDYQIHPDLIDTLSDDLSVLAEGVPVLVETQESYNGEGDDGDDTLYITRVLGGDLSRDGSKTPMTQDAFDRTLGRKGGIFRTAPSGARAEQDADESGGFFRIVDADNKVVGSIRSLLEEGRQRFIVGTGTSDPARVRLLKEDDGHKQIDLLADDIVAAGKFTNTGGVILPRGPQRLRGVDGNAGVQRNTGGNGEATVVHYLGAGGSFNAQPRGADASNFQMKIKNSTDTEVTWVVRYEAGNEFGEPANSLVTFKVVTFDWQGVVVDRS